jgi:hypothetical protein
MAEGRKRVEDVSVFFVSLLSLDRSIVPYGFSFAFISPGLVDLGRTMLMEDGTEQKQLTEGMSVSMSLLDVVSGF